MSRWVQDALWSQRAHWIAQGPTERQSLPVFTERGSSAAGRGLQWEQLGFNHWWNAVVRSGKFQGCSLVSLLAWKWPLWGPHRIHALPMVQPCVSFSDASFSGQASTVLLPRPLHCHLLTLLTQGQPLVSRCSAGCLSFPGSFYCRLQITAHFSSAC